MGGYMQTHLRVFLGFLFLLVFPFSCQNVLWAECISHPEGVFQFYVPDTWQKENSDKLLVVTSPSGNAKFVFESLPESNIPDAIQKAQADIQKKWGEPIVGAVQDVTVDELTIAVQFGYVEKQNVEFAFHSTSVPSGQTLMCYYFGNNEVNNQEREEMIKIFAGVEKCGIEHLQEVSIDELSNPLIEN
jgi:hypothetical protein